MALLLCLGTFFSRQACAQNAQTTQNAELVELDELPNSCMNQSELTAAVLAELGATEVPEGLRVQVELGENPGFILRDRDEVVSERRFESANKTVVTAFRPTVVCGSCVGRPHARDLFSRENDAVNRLYRLNGNNQRDRHGQDN